MPLVLGLPHHMCSCFLVLLHMAVVILSPGLCLSAEA